MSSTIRKPYLAVTLNGTPLSDVLSARAQAGFNLRVAEAQVALRALPDGIKPWDAIAITMGGTVGTAARRFTGFFIAADNQLYPKQTVLNCKGKLGLAEVLEAQTNIDMATFPGDPGHLDEVMVSTVLAICRLSDGWAPSGETHMASIGGTGRLLGHYSWDWGFEWGAGESGLSFIERLDEVCLGWRTYDTFDGTIVRTQISALPAGTPDFTFTEGVDIYRATESTTIIGARNRIVVTGWPGQDSKTEIKYTAETTNPFLLEDDGTPWYLTKQINSPMIEFEHDADLPAGYGLSCEQIAKWQLSEQNVYSERVTLTTPRDDVIQPGDTILVHAPTRLGVSNRLCWVQQVDMEVNRQGAFSQVLTCIRGVPFGLLAAEDASIFTAEDGDLMEAE